jgi:predicted transposase YdaD
VAAEHDGPKISAVECKPMHEFDKAARYLAKQDPANFFRWLGIMEQWKQVALTEPDARVRSTLGAFALVFALLADRDALWKQALEDWDMRNLQVVDYWHNEGRVEGRVEGQLEARRDDLVALLEKRFGSLPKELLQRIQGLSDVARLRAALQQVLDIDSLDELQL